MPRLFCEKKLKPVLTDLSLDDLDRFRRGLQNGDGLHHGALRDPTLPRRVVCSESKATGVVSKDQESNISDDVVDRVLGH